MLACGLHPAGTHPARPGCSPPTPRDPLGRFTCQSQQLLPLSSFSLPWCVYTPTHRLSPLCTARSGGCSFQLPLSPYASASSWSCSRILPPPGVSHYGQAAPLTEAVSSHPSFQGQTLFAYRGESYDDYVKMKVLRNSNEKLRWDREFVF